MTCKAMKKLDYDAYTVALLCPLEVELSAMRYLLDEEHQRLPSVAGDPNQYILGEMSGRNVVIASLPAGYQGTASAAAVAINMSRTFVSVHIRLLVGIGGGVPSEKADIRLGDVVVGIPTGIHGGVVQYDLGKQRSSGFERKGFLSSPPSECLHAVTMMRSSHRGGTSKVPAFLNNMVQKRPRLKEYQRPPPERDVLFQTNYEHVSGQDSCDRCDRARVTNRACREPYNEPVVHYGLIASGSRVLKDAVERDRIGQECGGAICFEMEAAGLMNEFSCIVIRGISDYADSHKNDEWHAYAAAAAAALAKELLEYMGEDPRQGNEGQSSVYQLRSLPLLSISGGQQVNFPVHSRAIDCPDHEQTFQTLLKSLSFARQDARLLNIRAAYTQTCQWVFRQAQFKEWHDKTKVAEHHRFLWIKGKPGSGKSTIMKKLYDAARANRGKIYGKTVSYFFNARAPGLLEKSSLGMYRSLAHQLLQALPQFQDYFVEHFSTKATISDVDEWTVLELQGFLTHVVENLGSQPVTILIDALDEGEEDDVRQMVMFLEELGQTAVYNKTQLMVCLSSRHYPHISIRKSVPLVVEGQTGHDDDIATYVRNHLNEDESPQMEELRERLCHKASGVFLWVVLVVPILKKLYDHGRLALMGNLLDKIPSELDDLFAQILARDNEDRAESILLFQWTLFAERPLSPTELFYAVASGLPKNWNSDDASRETIERYILNCSKGLAEISKSEPPTVYFIHETVRGFLLQKNGLAKIQPDLRDNMFGASHNQLTKNCVRYLSRLSERLAPSPSTLGKRQRNNKTENDREKEVIFRRFPLLEYVVTFMFNHADNAEATGFSQKHFLEEFNTVDSSELQKWIHFRNIFQPFKIRRYTPKATLLYILSEQNMYNLIRPLIEYSNVNSPGERYGNALQAACANGHEQTARLLVENTCADVNAQGGEHRSALLAAIFIRNDTIVELIRNKGGTVPKNILNKRLLSTIYRKYALGVKVLLQLGADANTRSLDRGTALQVAAYRRHQPIVQILLDNGANVNAQGGYLGNALQAACSRGHQQIVQILLDNGANVNAQNNIGNALQVASCNGHLQIVQILLDNGANINAQGGYYGNALQVASCDGHQQIVQILLENGANVNAQGGYLGNALQAACSRGHQQIVQILLDNGANINAQGGHYGNALQAASCNGQQQIVQMLLDNGANINAQGGYLGNALQAACSRGHQQIVQILLDNGANINAQGGHYGNALQAASCNGQQQIVQMLLDNGANINAQGGHYGNALQAASYNRQQQIVQMLLDNRANINAQGGHYGNALQAASSEGHQQIVQILLENGANVNAQGGRYSNALQAASSEGHQQIVQMLLDNGANVNAQGGYYGSSLYVASSEGHQQIVQMLLDNGANVNAQGGYYGSSLYVASSEGHQQIVQMLLDNGANVNAQGNLGNALQAASSRGHQQIVQMLLDNGANINAQGGRVVGETIMLPGIGAFSYSPNG
ncbi:ankyrin repeat-containing domain protein [Talaromyces proteolyticus]|uniref:Ankyrin repeat-containing domain protein n=1 Tax=Talaromyces proteolyticus TaxID=1131652 RepID=A0AAD4L0N4_9EURO|nr:ankyrin repeat-containing domain protein [Talaromyces proteolyticus]KAH8705408.1 ankyrin repeat-containing domain protein [Talaromyces proteolyticus]